MSTHKLTHHHPPSSSCILQDNDDDIASLIWNDGICNLLFLKLVKQSPKDVCLFAFFR